MDPNVSIPPITEGSLTDEQIKIMDDLNPKAVMKYVKYYHKSAISMESIINIIGGVNMSYDCIEFEQAPVVYEICRTALVNTLNESKRQILCFEEHNAECKKVILGVTLQPRSQKNREHVVIWATIMFLLKEGVPVGFVRTYNFTSK